MKERKKHDKKGTTIKDIAKKLGLSHRAVSQAINPRESTTKLRPETIEKIRKAAAESNYRPNTFARAIRNGRACVLGYFEATVGQWGYSIFGAETAIYAAAQDRGYHLMMIRFPSGDDCKITVPSIFMESNLDALIICHAGSLTPEVADAIDQTGLPVIFFNEKRSHNAVYVDDIGGSYEMTRYLLNRGYKRILLDRAAQESNLHYSVDDRHQGYLRAITEAGLEPIVHYNKRSSSEFLQFYEETKPDCIFTAGSLSAARLFRALYTSSVQIPRDVALTSYGLDWFTIEAPLSLTTMKLPIDEMAACAVDMAVNLLDHPEKKKLPSSVVTATLFEGESAPPRKPLDYTAID